MGFPAGSGPAVARMGGRGVTPTPPLFFFLSGGYPPPHMPGQQGGTPLPLRSLAGRSAKIQEKPQTSPFTPEIPREIQDQAMQKRCQMPTWGGGGWPPPPPPFFFSSGGYPPPMCRANRGVPPSPPFGKFW